MTERSLEEWVSHCEDQHAKVPAPLTRSGELLLCFKCARAYARQQVEAIRERVVQILETWPKECNCGAIDIGVGELHEPACGLPNPVEIAATIRALEVTNA